MFCLQINVVQHYIKHFYMYIQLISLSTTGWLQMTDDTHQEKQRENTRLTEYVAVQYLPKKATFTDVGRCGHRNVTAVTIPNVPSAPINKCFRWYPVLSLRIPLRQSITSPLAKTYKADAAIISFSLS